MSKQIRKLLALLLSFAMVVTSITFVGNNSLKAADEDAANQVELEEEQLTEEPEAETVESTDTETTEETLEIGEESEEASDGDAAVENGEEAAPEEEKEPARPAQVLKATASDGAKIIVDAPEGALPEGASVKVKVVSAKSVKAAVEKQAGDVEDLAAYDITLHDADGNEIQPKLPVSVEIKNADIDGKATGVYHVNDNKTNAEAVSATTSGDDAGFEASHFSIYVVVNGDPAVATYKFVYENGSEAAESQSIKDGETLVEPKTPAARNDAETFVGWYVGDKQFDSFGEDTPAVTSTGTITLTAKFRSVIYVFFMSSTADDADVAYTKEYKLEDKKAISVDDVEAPMNSNQVLEGWYTDKALKNKVNGTIVPTKDTKLYPNIITGQWLKFETNGGSYIEPIFVTGKTSAPAIPTKAGYTFLGWYADSQFKTEFKFGNALNDETEIYAKWGAKCEGTSYTVIHWLENASNDEYSFKEAETLTGKIGATTAAVAKTTGDYKGFKAETIEQKTIEQSGTIVNVYYKRQIYTLTFIGKKSCGTLSCGKTEHTHSSSCYSSSSCNPHPHHHDCWGGCGDWRYPYDCYPGYDCGKLTCTKEEHTHTSCCYSNTTTGETYKITAKYGAKIADEFNNEFFTKTYAGYAWESKDYAYALQTLDTMPNFNSTFNLYLTSNTSSGRSSNVEKTIYYYGTALPGDKDTVEYKGKQYTLIKAIKTYFTYMTYEEEYHNIEGFTRWSKTDAGFSGSQKDFCNKVGCLYYTRNNYTITFMNDGKTIDTKTFQYEQSIANAGFTPSRPAGVDANAQFVGWFDNQLCEGTPYNFTGKTMPAKNIVLYAKWKHVSSIVHVKDANTDKAKVIDQEVAYAGLVDQTKFPTVTAPAGKVFIGWGRLENGKVTKFNLSTKIYKETWLVPIFAPSNLAYQVSYSDGTNTYYDTQEYLLGSEAELLRFEETGLTAPAGKMFGGWLYSGNLYLPGDEIEISGNLALIAKWVNAPAKTKVTYNPGTGSGNVQTISALTNNGMYTLLSVDALGYTKANYEFVGWSFTDAKSGETKTLASGSVLVDTVNSDNNVFTAQWKKADANYTVNAYYENANGGFDAELIETRSGKIGNRVDVKEGDYTPKTANYKFAEGNKSNVLYGNVAANNALELKVYFVMKNASDCFDVVPADASKVYDSTALPASAASVKEKGKDGKTVDATIEYSTDGKNWVASASDLTATNVADSKTIYVRAKVAGYKGYVEGTQKLEITAKSVTVKADDKSKKYNEKDPEFTATVTGTIGTDKVNYSFSRATGSDVGSYTITVSGDKTQGNYTVDYAPGTLTIGKALILDLNVNAASFEGPYDGTVHGGAATSSVANTDIFYSIDDGKNWTDEYPTLTDAGDLTVLVKAENDNYEDAQTSYVINVTPRPVTLKSADLSKPFDGKPIVNGDTPLATNHGWVGTEGATFSFSGSQELVGTSSNTFTYTLKDGTKAGNYTISVEYGCLSITDRGTKYEITVVANSGEWTYDGQNHSVEGYEEDEFVFNDKTYKVSNIKVEKVTQKNAGTYSTEVTGEAVVKDASGNDVTSQFNVKGQNGTLTIKKATVTLKSADLSKPYDGDPLVNGNTGLATESGWAEGEGATYSFSGKQTAVGTSANAFGYELKSNTLAGNYTINKTEGSLNVTSRGATEEIVVEANSAETTYNGKQHEVSGLKTTTFEIKGKTYTVSGLSASGAKGTDAGVYQNVISGTPVVKNSQGEDVTSQYAVIARNGALTINKRAVTAKSADITREYNGKVLRNGNTALATTPNWADGEGATYSFTGTQKLVGSSDNAFSISMNANTKPDNYDVTIQFGTLKVINREHPYEIEVKANSDEVTFDGDEHSVSGFETLEFKVDGQDYEVGGLSTTGGKGTNAGTYPSTITGTEIVYDAEGYDVTDQFDVTKTNGALVINKATNLEINTEAAAYDGPYDAVEHGAPATVDVAGTTIEYSTDGGKTWVQDYPRLTNVGTINVLVKATNPNYEEANTSYIINIYPRTVTLKSADLRKQYDGKPLTNGNESLAVNHGWVNGEGATFSFSGSQTIVGTSSNTFTYALNEGTKASNYDIHTEMGCLTVTERGTKYEITVAAKNLTCTYDGKEHSVEGFVTNKFTVEGIEYTVSGIKAEKITATDAGTYSTEVTGVAVVKDASGNDVTAQFIVKGQNGTLTINKRAVTLRSADLEKEYDGDALVNGDHALAETPDWAEGEGATYTFNGSQRAVGFSANSFGYELNNNTKASNYEITKTEGTLNVTSRGATEEIVVEANSDTVTYDADEHEVTGLKSTSFTIKGNTYTVSGLQASGAKATDAGSYDNKVSGTPVVTDAYGDDVTEQFKVTAKNGTLKINKREVTVKSGDLTREYNGKILKDTAIANTPDWAEGEGATYTFTGTQKLPGSSQNKFSVSMNANTKPSNYIVNTEFGTLKVTNREVPFEIEVVANSDEVTFDNQIHEVTGFETLEFVVEEENYEVDGLTTSGAKGKRVGTYDNKIVGTAKVLDAEGYDVTAQFKVSKKDGKLVIKPAKGIGLDVGAADHQYVYNKTARGGDIAKVSVVEDTTISYSTDGGETWTTKAPTLTNVGQLAVTVKAENPDYETEQASYTITVTPATVKVTPRDYEKKLDKADPDFEADLEGLYDGDSITYELTRAEGEDVGEYTISVEGDVDQGNYTLDKKTGTLTIKAGEIGKKDDPDPNNNFAAVAEAPGPKAYNGDNQYEEPVVKNKKSGNKLERGTDYDLTWTKSLNYKNVGTKIVTITGIGNYEGSTLDLEYSITPKTVTVQPEGATKEFGQADPEFKASVEGLIGNDSIRYTVVRASGENVGKYTMSVAGSTTQGNYSLDKKTATFEITAGEIKPGPNPNKDGAATIEPIDNVTYNGKEQKEKPVVKNNKTGKDLVEGVDYELEYVPGGDYTNVGEKTVIVKGKGNYAKTEKIVLTYSIEPKEVKVTPDNKTKKINTEDPELTAKYEGLVTASDKNKINPGLVRDEGEEAGIYAIRVTADLEQGNYKLVPEEGEFTITEGKIGPWDDPEYDANVKPINDTVYSGKEQKIAPVIIEKETGEALDAENYDLAYTGDLTNVGTVKITITGKGDYNGSKFSMTYKIKPAAASVEAVSASKRFGQADPTLEAEVKNLVNNETKESAKIKYEISRAAGEDAGNYAITVKGDKAQGNYTLSYVGANFKIVSESINPEDKEPSGDDPEKPIYAGVTVDNPTDPVYNGREQKETPVVKNAKGEVLSEGKDYILIYTEGGDYTNVGEKTVIVKGIGNYSGEVTAKYTITPKVVTVTANNISITTEDEVPAPTATVAGTIGDDTVEYELNIGTVDGIGTYAITVNAAENQGNYKVVTTDGTLYVGKPKEKGIIVTPPQNPVYDGEDHHESPIVTDDEGNPLVEGRDYTVAYPSDDYTNAGEVELVVKGLGKYVGEYRIKYTIQKRNVILKSANAKRAYNGKPLMNTKLTVGGDGFVDGEGFLYKFNGSQTEVGSSPNTFEYLISEEYANTKAENYAVTLVFGTLRVTRGGIAVPADNDDNGNVIRAIANDGQIVLQEIADEETPLANFFEDCCILHLILMLMALCLYIYYMYDSKKRKNRIYELEEELASHGVIYW